MSKGKNSNSKSKNKSNKDIDQKVTEKKDTKATKTKTEKKKEEIKESVVNESNLETKLNDEELIDEEIIDDEENFIDEEETIDEDKNPIEDDNIEEDIIDEDSIDEDNIEESIIDEYKVIDNENDDEDEDEESTIDEEDFIDEDLEEEPIIEEKTTKENKKKNSKKDNTKDTSKDNKSKKKEEKNNKKTSNEKINKIEKLAKSNNKTSKTQKKNSNFLIYLDKNRFTIYGFIAGVIITVLIAIIIWPDRIATLKDGTQNVATVDGHHYTANDLYETMKERYSATMLVDEIDNDLLTEMYEENDEMKKEVESNAEYYFNMYSQYYGYTEEQFLSQNGFANKEAFLDYLKLDYRRNKYLDEYVEKNLSDKEIEDYYNDNVVGDINCQHILVETSSDSDSDDSSSDDKNKLSDDDAKALAQEIIDKLNDGTSWEDVQKEYKDKVTFEDLKYQSWDANLEESFMKELKSLEDNSYSTEPVKTSYGYHVIYRLDHKEKPTLKKVKEDIIEKLVSEKKAADSNLVNKALVNLRKEKNLKFQDTVLESKYNAYIKDFE